MPHSSHRTSVSESGIALGESPRLAVMSPRCNPRSVYTAASQLGHVIGYVSRRGVIEMRIPSVRHERESSGEPPTTMSHYKASFEIDLKTDPYTAQRLLEQVYDTIREESRSVRGGTDDADALLREFQTLRDGLLCRDWHRPKRAVVPAFLFRQDSVTTNPSVSHLRTRYTRNTYGSSSSDVSREFRRVVVVPGGTRRRPPLYHINGPFFTGCRPAESS